MKKNESDCCYSGIIEIWYTRKVEVINKRIAFYVKETRGGMIKMGLLNHASNAHKHSHVPTNALFI